jgi:hypothetical protein
MPLERLLYLSQTSLEVLSLWAITNDWGFGRRGAWVAAERLLSISSSSNILLFAFNQNEMPPKMTNKIRRSTNRCPVSESDIRISIRNKPNNRGKKR